MLTESDNPRPAPSALALGVCLAVSLALSKAWHWGWPVSAWSAWTDWLRDVSVSAAADVTFAAIFALSGAALLALTRRLPRARRVAGVALLVFGAASVFYAVASVQIFAFLRSPLTYALLYLAGDMKSMRSSIGSFVSPGLVLAMVLAPLVYVLLVRLASPAWRRSRGHLKWLLPLVLVAGAATWGRWGWLQAEGHWSDRSDRLIAKNPHWEFLSSLIDEARGVGTPSMAETFPAEFLTDFQPVKPAPARALPAAFLGRMPGRARPARPRNVVLVVLESTGARYLSLYGSKYKTTPHLDAEAAHSLVFDNFYAHVGLTANSMAAMGLSIYPYMTWREYTQEYPEFPGQTVADVLKPLGWRTSFMTSSYLDYVGMDDFLRNRGFDEVRDWPQLSSAPPTSSWGGDESVLVDRTLEWIDRDRERPFYAMLWTQQSHHPYDPAPGQPIVDFFAGGKLPTDEYDLGRYLNTLAEVDRQLGRLFAGLRERGLDRDTLVVVTGDHGECFGDPHTSWGHGSRLYQAGLQVPMMLWSPTLFAGGQRVATLGGHVDVNPTILDLLGLPAAPSWEGRSLLAPHRAPRVYFYAAADDYLLGVREGNFKYIYNVTRGRDELYDLTLDPDERVNLASTSRSKCALLRQRLAAWKQHAAGNLARAQQTLARVAVNDPPVQLTP